MRIVSTIAGLLLLWTVAAIADTQPGGETAQVRYTRQTAFGLPYFMDPAEPGARRAVEVQLHVSESGLPWKLASKSAPTNGSFLFRASRDGEYRFAILTKDDHGEIHPPGPLQPELVVIVDTDPPVLELLVERGSGGEVRARWHVRDAHLRFDSMRLEYQVGRDGPWTPVAIDLPAVGATSSARETTWMPEARQVPIMIRAEVSDLAGNIAKTQREIPGITPKPRSADAGPNAAADVETPWPGERTQETPFRAGDPPAMSRSFPARREGEVTRSPPEEVAPREMIADAETLPPPQAEPVLAQPSGERRLPIPVSPEEVGLPPTGQEPHRTMPNVPREVDSADGPSLPSLASDQPAEPLAPPRESAASAVPPRAAESVSPGRQPSFLSQRRFEVHYNANTTPEGIKQVEVWGTKDDGRTWNLFAVDADHRSPAIVNVDHDGLYGFRIVVESTAGLRGATPQTGDAPDILVNVDTAKPVAHLTSAGARPGGQPSAIAIRWDAADATFGARPVSLYYFSPQAGGRWIPIAIDLENTGEYVWQPDNQVPPQVYVRMIVRDQAGNVQAVDAPQPVTIVPAAPRGRTPEARPISTEPSAGETPTWQEYRR